MKNKIKERLEELMKEKSITPYKLSKDLNISKSVIHYWKIGKTTPSADYIIQLALYFDVSSDYILGLEDDFGGKTYINNSFNNFSNSGNINI